MRISDWSSDVCSSDLRWWQLLREQCAEFVQALVERTGVARQVEHEQTHLPPRIVIGRNAAYGCRCALEAPASGPEFAIERRLRPTRREPRGRAYWRPATRPQALAVPVATHPAKLLAHPIPQDPTRVR